MSHHYALPYDCLRKIQFFKCKYTLRRCLIIEEWRFIKFCAKLPNDVVISIYSLNLLRCEIQRWQAGANFEKWAKYIIIMVWRLTHQLNLIKLLFRHSLMFVGKILRAAPSCSLQKSFRSIFSETIMWVVLFFSKFALYLVTISSTASKYNWKCRFFIVTVR